MLLAFGAHGEEPLHEVRIGGDHDASGGGGEDLVGAGRACAATKVDTDPGSRIDSRFGVLLARLHGERAAPEGHDAQDARLLASEQLVGGRSVLAVGGWSAGAIEHVHRHLDGVRPVRGRDVPGREVGPREGEDGADGALGDAVQSVDVRWAGRLCHELLVE